MGFIMLNITNFIDPIYLPNIAKGIAVTILATLISLFLSVAIGTVLGIVSCNYLKNNNTYKFIKIYIFIAKGIPLYVQILISYFVLPTIIGINLSGFVAGVLALAFCSSGYMCEIIRAGLNSVPVGQWEACYVLGYNTKLAIQRIILPQAFKNILPALFGEIEQLLKSTSLLATIGVTELTRAGMNIISRDLNPISIYILIALIFLILGFIINIIFMKLERKAAYVNS